MMVLTLEEEFNKAEKDRRTAIIKASEITKIYKDTIIATVTPAIDIRLSTINRFNELNTLCAAITYGIGNERKRFRIELNDVDKVIDGLTEIKKVTNMNLVEFEAYIRQRKVLEKI